MQSLSTRDLSSVLLEIYRRSEQIPPDGFPDWALGQLSPYVPFNGATWVTGYMDGNCLRSQRFHAGNLPPEMRDQYQSVEHLDGLARRAVEEPGIAVAAPMREAGADAAFRAFCERWRLAQGLAIVAVDPLTLVATGLTLYREPARPPFSEGERAFFETAAPHLVETYAMCTLSWMVRAAAPGSTRILSSAIADQLGELQIAPPDFPRLLLQEWPGWHERRLPAAIRELDGIATGTRYTGERIVIVVSRMNDVFLVQAREKHPADALSDRELEVARMMAGGLTYKEVAQELGIAPSTVRNHVAVIYAKLRVGKQSEMAAALRVLE